MRLYNKMFKVFSYVFFILQIFIFLYFFIGLFKFYSIYFFPLHIYFLLKLCSPIILLRSNISYSRTYKDSLAIYPVNPFQKVHTQNNRFISIINLYTDTVINYALVKHILAMSTQGFIARNTN